MFTTANANLIHLVAETERLSHYFWARLPQQFEALLHFDETRARRAPRPDSGLGTG